jgi:hypothetical protein
MSWEVQYGRYYCTTSECEFGPQCVDDNEAWALCEELKRRFGEMDPRAVSLDVRKSVLAEMRATRLASKVSL